MKTKHNTLATLAATLITFGSFAGGVNAATIFSFSFTDNTPAPLVLSSDGIDLRLSNPTGLDGSTQDLRNALGGLAFSDTVTHGQIELLFGQDVRLVSFVVSNAESDGNGDFFNLNQGMTTSLNNPVDQLGTFTFNNSGNIYLANTPIILQTGDLIEGRTSEPEAWSISSLTVQAIPEPSSAFLIGVGVFGFAARRRRTT